MTRLSISIHDQLRRALQCALQRGQERGQEVTQDADAVDADAVDAGGKRGWPSIDEYEDWCDCSPGELNRFIRGHKRRLAPQIIEPLLFLTGIYPRATKEERRERISDARDWCWEAEIYMKFLDLMDFLETRYLIRHDLPDVDPDPPLPETVSDWYELSRSYYLAYSGFSRDGWDSSQRRWPVQETGFYRQILGLNSPWLVADVALDMDAGQVDIRVEHDRGIKFRCPVCGSKLACYDHAPMRRWRHLDTMQYKTVLHAALPRVKCPEHGVKQVRLPWAEQGSRFDASNSMSNPMSDSMSKIDV